MGCPASEEARAGWGTTQAPIRVSSPRRKRWQRIPAVARPLAGKSVRGETFREPVCSSGGVAAEPATVTTSAAAVTSMAPKERTRSEEHTSELQSRGHLVCRLLLEKKNQNKQKTTINQ